MPPSTALEVNPGLQWKAWRERIFLACWLAYCGYYICRRILVSAHGSSDSSTVFLFGLSYGISQFAAGTAADRYGGRVVALAGSMLSVLCILLLPFANLPVAFAGLQILSGMGQGCGFPAVCKILGSWFHSRERGIIIAWWSTSYSLGGFMAASLAGTVASSRPGLDRAVLLLIPSAIVLAICAFWYWTVRDAPAGEGFAALDTGEPAAGLSWWDILKFRELHLLAGMYFFLKLTRYTLLLWLPLYLIQNLRYSRHFAETTAALFELVGFAGMIGAAYLSDVLLRRRRYTVSSLMLFALAFVCLLHPVFSQLGWAATAASISAMGILVYGPDVLMTATAVLDAVPAGAHGRATAYVNGIGSFGQMLSPFIASAVVSAGGWDSLFNVFVLCAILSGSLLALRWNQEAGADMERREVKLA